MAIKSVDKQQQPKSAVPDGIQIRSTDFVPVTGLIGYCGRNIAYLKRGIDILDTMERQGVRLRLSDFGQPGALVKDTISVAGSLAVYNAVAIALIYVLA